ncbi:hypothetical protein [Nostoc parmelioides]|uniref:Uncharacterized protein n=1 Tax=Nostoc parmelioides FACHB-3921 TaxID=2692909 RepID=A0ABR8B964_9NOSO|nr:hypothetical protein [Nostoc parmelioides]MBD2250368.1 hypothetical protein [Nostoc parmelioides FACHB-3921]
MEDNKSQTNNPVDVIIAIPLQIPQGNTLQLQVEQNDYSFYLNQQVVEQIQEAKNKGTTLEIPLKLLLPLWYYTCFSHNVVSTKKEKDATSITVTNSYTIFLINILQAFWSKSLQKNTSLQPGFTFTSYYQQEQLQSVDAHKQERVLQSVVLFHGDILHKIKWDLLNNNFDCQKIVTAHYWLIEQILGALRSKLNLLVWEIAAIVPAGFLAYSSHSVNGLTSIITWIGATITIAFSRPVLVKILRRFTTIKSENIDNWAWAIVCSVSGIISHGVGELSNLYLLLLLILSWLTPEIVKPTLRYVWPLLGKFMIRSLSRLPF